MTKRKKTRGHDSLETGANVYRSGDWPGWYRSRDGIAISKDLLIDPPIKIIWNEYHFSSVLADPGSGG